MNIIFQKFLAVIESLIAILVPLHVASRPPTPAPTELAAAATPTPLPGFTSTPSPSASPTPIPAEVPEPTSAITPLPDPISELVEQLKQLKEEVAKMTPVPMPAPTLVPPSPSPMPTPTPNPTISVLPVMSDTEYMVLTEPARVGTITIQITDENGEVADPNGAQVSLVNGDGRTEGPTREVLPMQPITGTTMTLNVNAELYRKSRLAFGAGNPARRVYYKVLAVEGFDIVVR